MLWDKRKRKRNQTVFRNIAVYDPMRQRTPIRLHFTKIKTIIKECHTTIQRHDSIHNTYPIHLYIRQISALQEAYPTLYQTKNSRYIALREQRSNIFVSQLQLHDIMRQKLYEERRYFQSHPYQARRLALSYLKSDVIRSALHQHIQLSKRYAPSGNHPNTPNPIYLKSAISSQQMQEVLTSQLQQAIRQEAQPIINTKPLHVPIPEKIVVPQPDEEPLIRRVVKEVLHRLRQEKMREGR